MPGLGLSTPDQDKFIDTLSTYFLGEPNKLLNAKEGDAEDADEPPADADPVDADDDASNAASKKAKDSDESEEEEIKVPKRNLTEVNRLALIVNAIENDCHICPVGAFRMTPHHELRRDESFRGVCAGDNRLENYAHFRNV